MESQHNRSSSVLAGIHPDDLQCLIEKVSQVKASLEMAYVDVRIGTGPHKDIYKKFGVSIMCSIDDNGTPIRFQITLSEKSE